MRWAIFSDIHGNLDALDAVLSDIESQKPDRMICLGDVVGYGATPNECVDRVRATGAEVLCGNHDHAATGQLVIDYFNDNARAAIEWTRQALTPESLAWLKERPYEVRHPGFLAVHASPTQPQAWDYILSAHAAAGEFDGFKEPLCFIGHSHFPVIYRQTGGAGGRVSELEFPPNQPMALPMGARQIVNVGSVGQPRDNDPRAAWTLFDARAGTLELRRVEYPVQKAAERILAAGLPAFLAARLEVGM